MSDDDDLKLGQAAYQHPAVGWLLGVLQWIVTGVKAGRGSDE